MARKPWNVLLTAVMASASLACACNRSQTNQAPAAGASAIRKTAAASPDTVVAKIGETNITLGALDEEISAQLQELGDQEYEIRKQGLDVMINKNLVKAAAFKKGLTEDKYLQEEVQQKVVAPTDEAVQKFFDDNKAQLPPSAKFADFKERIGQFLRRQAETDQTRKVFTQLREEAHVDILLKAPPKPRINVEAKGPEMGPKDAKVQIVEFSDFECPFCSKGKNTMDEVMKKYAGKVHLVFRQFPLSFHSHAKKAAEAALCADAQGKFWPMHDKLFAEQKALEVADLKKYGKELGLDEAAFATCLDGGSKAQVIDEDMAAAQKVGVTGTPAFFINGLMLSGAQPVEEFSRIIDEELKGG